ncbi:MAG: hypothetical protein HRU01_22505 [Myxococcales bacterium]|nr:hypothetical protein [Myxococcales bacterium]
MRTAGGCTALLGSVLACAGVAALTGSASAELYSHLAESSVIGRDFGYPSGTPSQGHPPPGTLEFVPEVAVFMENIEKLGSVPGRTFVGFLMPLRFRLRPAEQVTFELGALLGHDYGDDSQLNTAEPIVRLVAEPVDDLFLVGGTLLPTHWIHDALLDDVNRLQSAEQGFQVRADRETLKLDGWLNWRVRETGVRAEEFEIALATQLRPDWALLDGLHIDGQVLWAHVGGQQNSSDRVEHNLSLMGGGTYGVPHPFAVDWLEEVRAGGHYFRVFDDTRQLPSTTGSGWEVAASIDTRPWERVGLRVHGSYFDGTAFVARRGDPLYSLDDYAQLGMTLLFDLPADLRLEGGVVLQLGEGQFNGSFLINLVFGRAFPIPVMKARNPAQ